MNVVLAHVSLANSNQTVAAVFLLGGILAWLTVRIVDRRGGDRPPNEPDEAPPLAGLPLVKSGSTPLMEPGPVDADPDHAARSESTALSPDRVTAVNHPIGPP